ncbi:hypothetical protein D9M69_573440 [compost metagenome]
MMFWPAIQLIHDFFSRLIEEARSIGIATDFGDPGMQGMGFPDQQSGLARRFCIGVDVFNLCQGNHRPCHGQSQMKGFHHSASSCVEVVPALGKAWISLRCQDQAATLPGSKKKGLTSTRDGALKG